MKKFLIGGLLAAGICMLSASSVKADAALTQAQDFANMQNVYMNAQFDYFNTYQIPVLNTYNQAMSDQMAQALAAQYQANMMYQMAMQRKSVNDYQLGMNYNAAVTNLNAQYINFMNNHLYNFENNFNNMYFNTMGNVNSAYGNMLLQPKFPQMP